MINVAAAATLDRIKPTTKTPADVDCAMSWPFHCSLNVLHTLISTTTVFQKLARLKFCVCVVWQSCFRVSVVRAQQNLNKFHVVRTSLEHKGPGIHGCRAVHRFTGIGPGLSALF
eukprot:6345509-Amphidinium_carterae.1